MFGPNLFASTFTLFAPRKWWLCPDITEKLLTAKLSLNTKLYLQVLLLVFFVCFLSGIYIPFLFCVLNSI